jgi:hypothetical protein
MTSHQFQTGVRDLAARCARVVHGACALGKTEGVGNAGCPPHPQPRVQCVGSTRVSHHGRTGTPGIPARNGFNGLFRALPGDRACLSPSLADMACLRPVGPTYLRELDAGVEASGPHDFAVRSKHLSSARPVIAHRPIEPALPSRRVPNAAASTASRPASVTIAIRPSVGTRRRGI